MPPLEPPDLHHCNAAIGWLELGNVAEAIAELESIAASQQSHPDVLDARWRIYAHEHRWPEALETARLLVNLYPDRVNSWINQSFALHELKRTPEAYDQLRSVEPQFNRHEIVAYNLACYACILGNSDKAVQWLRQALGLGDADEIRRRALADPDLEGLRDVIPTLTPL